jgi:ribosome biogenesis GTPase A
MAPQKHRSAKVTRGDAVLRKSHPGLPGEKSLGLVDIFLFLADARIPWTTRKLAEPYLSKKRRLYILTKPDLADPKGTEEWVRAFQDRGEPAFPVDCRTGQGLREVVSYLGSERKRIAEKKGAGGLERPLRLMLFGVPNVGKSSLANRLLGNQKAPFGARPGLTRGSNWLKGRGFVTVLDTPGVLDTSKVKGEAKMKLAASWALPENAYDVQDVGVYLASRLPDVSDPAKYIEEYGRARGFLASGGIVEVERASKAVLQAFRDGELGRITLERPSDFAEFGGGQESNGKETGEEP